MLIASRLLFLRNSITPRSIAIEVHAPRKAKDGAWSCRYAINWPQQPSDREVFGFDSMQALFLALQTIGAEIYSSSYHQSGNLFFGKEGEGYGFPVVPTLRDLLVGSDVSHV